MANILLVSENKSFISLSLVNHLKNCGHQVFQIGTDLDSVEKFEETMQLFIIYAEEELLIERQMLVYLKDKAIEDNIPIIVIGDAEQIEEAEKIILKQSVTKHFLRPINVNEVVEYVNEYLEKNSNLLKHKILVVDDSGAVLRNVKGWLEDKYQVILANSGTMAIKYLSLNHPDLILLDYEMPICDGRQVLEMIRSESEFSHVPVIFLTNKNDKESVMSVTALKPEGYLLKTMEPGQIVQAIDDFFERQKGKM